LTGFSSFFPLILSFDSNFENNQGRIPFAYKAGHLYDTHGGVVIN
jgi:hypothetical protein